VFASLHQMEAALDAREPPLIEVKFETVQGITPAKVKIAEPHATQMSKMSDTALSCCDGGIERYRTDDPNEVLHLDGKEKIEIDDLIGIDQAIREQDAVHSARSADARHHLIGRQQSIEDAAAQNRNEIVLEKENTAPAALEIAAEHPKRQHIE